MLELPFSTADGNITVHSTTRITVFGHGVFLQPAGLAIVVDPQAANDPQAARHQWPLLDAYGELLKYAISHERIVGGTIVSIGPRDLAHMVGSRHVTINMLRDDVRPVGGGTYELVVPPKDKNPKLTVYVNPAWEDQTHPGMRRN